MVPEKTDKIFKTKFEKLSDIPKSIHWNKEDAWNKLKKKSKRQNLKKILKYSSAAVFIAILYLSFPKFENLKNRKSFNTFQNEHEEYRKRQKLREIEMRLSGKKIYTNYCMNCEGLLPDKNKIPVNIIIFTN